MLTRHAIWLTPAILLTFAIHTHAQTTPKTPAIPAVNGSSVQIIPVSFTNEQVAATVNGEKIFVGDVRKILDQRVYPNRLSEDDKKKLREAAVDVLVEDAVVRQYLSKVVPQVSQADFDKEFKELQDKLAKENKTIDKFLAENGQTMEQVRRDIIAKLQWKALLVRIYPDDKLQPYYDANKPFFDKVFVQASHILLKLPANPTKDQRDKLVQLMLVWRQEIIAGKVKFEDVAKQYSQCDSKDNKEKPGDIGQFPLKFVVLPEFGKAAFALKKNEISDIVQTVSGLHLIWVTDRTNGVPSTFNQMKETVREVWAQDDDIYNRVLTEQMKAGDVKKLLQ